MRTILCAGFLAVFGAGPAQAQEPPAAPGPILQTNINSIWFDNWVGLSNAMLRVASPDGRVETILEETRSPTYRLSGSPVADGRYRFELRAATDKRVPNESDLPSLGDDDRPRTLAVPFYMTGAFVVERGAIVASEDLPREERDN